MTPWIYVYFSARDGHYDSDRDGVEEGCANSCKKKQCEKLSRTNEKLLEKDTLSIKELKLKRFLANIVP